MAQYESLRVCLKDWVDFDVAEFHLARCLGIMEEEVPEVSAAKAVFWSNNPVGRLLGSVLAELKREGMIEIDEEESKIRWNPLFSWDEKAFAKMKNEPNQPPQRNAGSRPLADDSSASKTSSSLGPRG